tara:strand:- start:971 stop:1372 length:402 start_codon:yes stop_codon:yes gene_type:complete
MINFTLGKNNLDGLILKLKELDKDKTWTVKVSPYKSTRSLEQNSYWWKLLTEWQLYYSNLKNVKESNSFVPNIDEWNEYFKDKYLTEKKPFGKKIIVIQKSTKDLKLNDMGEFLDTVKNFMYNKGFIFNEEEI